jgi:amino acid transporter
MVKNMTLSLRTLISDTNKNRISSKAVFALVFYLILPAIALLMIIAIYPELDKSRLLGILSRIIPIACILILISQFQVRYQRGSKGRFILNEVYVIMVVVWLFAFLGGEPVIHQTWEEYSFSLQIYNYLIVILFVTAMNVLYYILEYMAFSQDEEEHTTNIHDAEKEEIGQPKGVIITTISVE